MLQKIFDKIDREQNLTRDEIVFLLKLENGDDLKVLFGKADRVRQKYVGDEVHLRGLIEFSNYCRKNCLYCGIRRDNKKLKRYRMSIGEIEDCAVEAERLGYRTVVLQSGEDMYYTADRLAELIGRIKRRCDVAITLSIGERPREEYRRLFEAGADRFLIRFETSNPELYKKLHPDSFYEERMRILTWLKEIGYQVGSGIMVGLPGQTVEDLADDILKFEELELDMVGIGPYICHQDTPLAGSRSGSAEMTYKVVALTRIVTRCANIPATTALATLRQEDGRETALQLGANVVMPNVTPPNYRAMYELYPDKVCIGENARECRDCMQGRIFSIGRTISGGYGHSYRGRNKDLGKIRSTA
ncbi:MAG TPA: [FeFe] hydrogenase H-cluster radical SAM maturase HydE [Bacillota bacterium]|nr:[FeFe] hydrogenase H-cluster radical SAM maturase HydE [Bacillota bacterium]